MKHGIPPSGEYAKERRQRLTPGTLRNHQAGQADDFRDAYSMR